MVAMAKPDQEHNRELTQRVEAIAERVAASNGLELVEAEVLGGGKARVVRLTIDKQGGVTHEDCALMSQTVGGIMDAEDVIPGEDSYSLEVSSPGVERKLKKPRDWERFVGENVKVILREPVAGSKVHIARLVSFTDGTITLEGKELIQFPLSIVKSANLRFDWSAGGKISEGADDGE